MSDPEIQGRPDVKRYERPVDGQTAVVTSNLPPGSLVITETLDPEAFEGRDISSRLAKHVLANAKAGNLNIIPRAPRLLGLPKKHSEHGELVHPTNRSILGI